MKPISERLPCKVWRIKLTFSTQKVNQKILRNHILSKSQIMLRNWNPIRFISDSLLKESTKIERKIEFPKCCGKVYWISIKPDIAISLEFLSFVFLNKGLKFFWRKDCCWKVSEITYVTKITVNSITIY